MTVSDELFLAILAMDSYNRGYGAGIDELGGIGSKLGNATISTDAGKILGADAQAAGFYAVAYKWGDTTVIAYRGTDNVTGKDPGSYGGSDLVNGWLVGAGLLPRQAELAEQFYARVTGDGSTSSRPASVILTGHSMGGGLAGYVAALTGDKATVFNNMPYFGAALRRSLEKAVSNGDVNSVTLPTTDKSIHSINIDGEAVAPIRSVGPTAMRGSTALLRNMNLNVSAFFDALVSQWVEWGLVRRIIQGVTGFIGGRMNAGLFRGGYEEASP